MIGGRELAELGRKVRNFGLQGVSLNELNALIATADQADRLLPIAHQDIARLEAEIEIWMNDLHQTEQVRDTLAKALEEAVAKLESLIHSGYDGTASLNPLLKTLEPWLSLLAQTKSTYLEDAKIK